MFQAALDDAKTNPAVKNVMVFAHHPVDDPAEHGRLASSATATRSRWSRRCCPTSATDSNKGVSMVGSHAQIADVHRIEGVPYTVLPSSGKDPYGTPDRGGFTGWLDWHVDKDASAVAAVADGRRPRVRAVDHARRARPRSRRATAPQLDGSIVQPQGVTNGTRVVPLRYPMSVHWSGSDNLAIGTDVAAAKAAGKVAILDPVTRKLTGLHTGDVTVRVTNDSMREYTGDASLAPITTEKTIHVQVTHVGSDAPVGGSVPATLALTVGGPVSFGAFTPGVTKDYTASTTANVTSTAGDAALTASAVKLANGAFSLAQPVAITPEKTRLDRPGHQRRVRDRLQAVDRRHGPAAHGQLQRRGHVHAVDHDAVSSSSASERLVRSLAVVLEDLRDQPVAERDAQAEIVLVAATVAQAGGHVLLDEGDVRVGGGVEAHVVDRGSTRRACAKPANSSRSWSCPDTAGGKPATG